MALVTDISQKSILLLLEAVVRQSRWQTVQMADCATCLTHGKVISAFLTTGYIQLMRTIPVDDSVIIINT